MTLLLYCTTNAWHGEDIKVGGDSKICIKERPRTQEEVYVCISSESMKPLSPQNFKKWGLLVEWLSSSISGKFCKMTSYQKAIVSECNMSSSFWPWQFFQRELFPPKRHCVSWYCRHTKIHQKLRASLQKRKSLPFSTEVLRSSAAAFFCIVRRHNSLLVLLISQLVPLLREQSMERYISFLPWNVGLCRKLFFCTVEIYKVQCIGNWTDVLQYVIRFLFQKTFTYKSRSNNFFFFLIHSKLYNPIPVSHVTCHVLKLSLMKQLQKLQSNRLNWHK